VEIQIKIYLEQKSLDKIVNPVKKGYKIDLDTVLLGRIFNVTTRIKIDALFISNSK
jgi:hypothetical protein